VLIGAFGAGTGVHPQRGVISSPCQRALSESDVREVVAPSKRAQLPTVDSATVSLMCANELTSSWWFVLMAVVGTFAMNIPMIIALMATEVYGVGSIEFGILGSGMAIGSLVGGLAVARLTPRRGTVVASALVLGAVLVAQGFMPNYVTFAATMPLVGIASVTVNISAQSYIQVMSVAHMRGRVISLLAMANAAGRPASALFFGWAAQELGERWVPIGCGVFTVLGVAATTFAIGRNQTFRDDSMA
jgi:MFS family permease